MGSIGYLLIGGEAKAAAGVVEAPQQRLKDGKRLGGVSLFPVNMLH